jgi:hypothetical protein
MEKNVQQSNSFLTGILAGMTIITLIWILGQYMDPRREADEERLRHLFDVVIGNDKVLKQVLVEVKKNEMKNEEWMKHLFDVVIGNDKGLKQLLAEVKKNENEFQTWRENEFQSSRINVNVAERELKRKRHGRVGLDLLEKNALAVDMFDICNKWGIGNAVEILGRDCWRL